MVELLTAFACFAVVMFFLQYRLFVKALKLNDELLAELRLLKKGDDNG